MFLLLSLIKLWNNFHLFLPMKNIFLVKGKNVNEGKCLLNGKNWNLCARMCHFSKPKLPYISMSVLYGVRRWATFEQLSFWRVSLTAWHGLNSLSFDGYFENSCFILNCLPLPLKYNIQDNYITITLESTDSGNFDASPTPSIWVLL